MKPTSLLKRLATASVALLVGLTADSARAQLVPLRPQIVEQPPDRTTRAGSTVSLAVVAEGSDPLAYQWFRDGLPLPEDGHFSGTRSPALRVAKVGASDAGGYLVTVSNALGSTNSTTATLTVQPWHPWQVVGNLPNTDEITRRLVVEGTRAYLANGYLYGHPTANTGLRIVDVTDPSAPNPVGVCRTNYAEANSVSVSGDRAYVVLGTSPPFGLGVVDVSNPASPSFLSVYDTTSTVESGKDVTLSGDRAYAALGSTLHIFDVSDPAHPVRLGGWTNSYSLSRVVLVGTTAYVAGSGLHVIDVSDPEHPARLGGVSPADVSSVALTGHYAVTAGPDRFRVYDVSNASNVVRKVSLTLSNALDLFLAGDLAFVACGSNGVAVVDISDPLSPTVVDTTRTVGEAMSLALADDVGYVADGAAGLTLIVPGSVLESVPSISRHPPGQVVTAGVSTGFSVVANGAAPLRYQWRFGLEPIDGATNSILWLAQVEPAQAGYYSVVVTNSLGNCTSAVAVLNVDVPPRLDIRLSDGLPQLELSGLAGYDYAVEYAPEIPWATGWVVFTNVTLTAETRPWVDTSVHGVSQRYYRARPLDLAPSSLAGKTIHATVTNVGPFSVTLAYDTDTYTQTNDGEMQSGTYVYAQTGPRTALVSDRTTAPAELAGDSSTAYLTFTSLAGGTFVNNSFDPEGEVETVIGIFEINDSP